MFDLRKSSRIKNSNSYVSIKILPPSDELSKDSPNNNNRMQLFARTKSNKRNSINNNSINVQVSKYTSTNLQVFNSHQFSHANRRKSRTIHGFDNDLEEIHMREIYKIKDDENVPKLIQKFINVKGCSILKYGLKMSNESIDFSFCRTCDPNLIKMHMWGEITLYV